MLIVVAALLWLAQQRPLSRPRLPAQISSADIFARTYLNVAARKPLSEKRSCHSCHDSSEGFPREHWNQLTARWKLTAAEWAAALQLESRCGACHVTPDPRTLPARSWNEAVYRMDQIMEQKGVARLTPNQRLDLVHYYYAYSPENFPSLPPDPDPNLSPIQFISAPLGRPISTNLFERPFIGHVQATDLDQNGRPDLLVCESDNSSLNWIRELPNTPASATDAAAWREESIANLPCPARAAVFTNRTTGRLDIIAACQQRMIPTDDPIGSVVLLRNHGPSSPQFTPITILSNISRVAAVEPGDFNRDGQIDFLVAAFGHITTGEIGLLEAHDETFSYQPIVKRSGAIRSTPIDLNRDGHLDFIALFGQEHEQISVFLNNGNASFREIPLFKAATPSFGSSSLELVDLDRDGDTDILFTNGDNMDLENRLHRPYHGVQWLENRHDLQFIYHNLIRLYGAYCALPADLDNDGHLDIIVASLFNDWQDPTRASLLWLQNNGRQQFTPHTIARAPIQLISATIADLNHDNRPDLITSGMHIFPPYDRTARITLWTHVAQISQSAKALP